MTAVLRYGLGLAAIVVLSFFLYRAYIDIGGLTKELNSAIGKINALDAMIQRTEISVNKLSENDARRKRQLDKYAKQLETSSAEVRAVLSVVIPPEALNGLSSYEGRHTSPSSSTVVPSSE